jgi:hypothetical protein
VNRMSSGTGWAENSQIPATVRTVIAAAEVVKLDEAGGSDLLGRGLLILGLVDPRRGR